MALFPVLSGRANFDSSDNAATDTFSAGIRYTQAGAVRTTPDAGTVFNQGIPMSPSGQVAVLDATAGLPADVTWLSGMPISGNKVCVSTNAVSAVSSGTPYDAAGAVAGSGYFIPRMLFLSGAEGVWYDPSDSATLFSDTAGTTPCAAPGAGALVNVGLMLDKSKGLVLGSELVTNGDFSQGSTGWTAGSGWVISGGSASFSAGTANSDLVQAIGLPVIGRTYRITLSQTYGSGGQLRVIYGGQFFDIPAASGSYTFILTASTSTEANIRFRSLLGTSVFSIDNISVRVLPGNHAISYNATTARPELSARVNLLTYSEEPENATWTKSNSYVQQNLLTWSQDFSNATAWPPTNITVTNAATTAPDGTNTAQSIAVTTTAATLLISAITTVSATSATYSVYVKQGSGANSANTFIFRNHTTATNLLAGTLNYSTGVFTYTIGSTGVSVQNVGNGWWRLIMTVTSGVTSGDGLRGYVGFSGASETAGTFLYAWGAQLVQGSTAGDYTQTTSAAAPTRYLNWDGTLTGRKLVEDTVNTSHYVNQSVVTTAVTHAYNVYLKAGERSFALLWSPTANFGRVFNLASGTVSGTVAGVTQATADIASVGGGWYRCTIYGVCAAGSNAVRVYTMTDATTFSYTGDGTSGIYVSDFDLRPANIGANVPVYQRIADQYTYDTVGFPRYLRFDGVDDGMSTPANLNLSATDKATVFAGVRKLSDAATFSVVSELSTNLNTNAGAFALYAPGSSGTYAIGATGATLQSWGLMSTYTAPITNVLSNSLNLSGANRATQIVPRVNGALVSLTGGLDSANIGGNFGTYPLYIGARNNASLWFNGYLYSLIVVGAAATAAQVSSTESWIAGKEGITL